MNFATNFWNTALCYALNKRINVHYYAFYSIYGWAIKNLFECWTVKMFCYVFLPLFTQCKQYLNISFEIFFCYKIYVLDLYTKILNIL